MGKNNLIKSYHLYFKEKVLSTSPLSLKPYNKMGLYKEKIGIC